MSNINQYPDKEKLIKICKSFETEEISLTAICKKKNIPICNCNAVGDILEDVFYSLIKEQIVDFEKGPKQFPPDYYVYGLNEKFEFEQKVFMKSPGFDIGNFTSYVNMLCEEGGVFKKLFKTKYLVFEYEIIDKKIKIIKFHYLNVYNLVGNKTDSSAIQIQKKKNIWYNIRPGTKNSWSCLTKTPQSFIDGIVNRINDCPHIEDKVQKIENIEIQFENIKKQFDINNYVLSSNKLIGNIVEVDQITIKLEKLIV
jgi:hypothetical protein